jgi:hypothetical protein
MTLPAWLVVLLVASVIHFGGTVRRARKKRHATTVFSPPPGPFMLEPTQHAVLRVFAHTDSTMLDRGEIGSHLPEVSNVRLDHALNAPCGFGHLPKIAVMGGVDFRIQQMGSQYLIDHKQT